jgi:hypothetical protein
MNPGNGAIFPPTSTSTGTIRSRSTYAVGAAYETYSLASSSYYPSPSPSPSSSPSPTDTSTDDDESFYSAWIATASSEYNATSSELPADSSTTTKAMTPLKIATFGVPAIVGFILLVVGIWCCCRCRRRRKARRTELAGEGEGGGDGEMRQVTLGYDREPGRPQSLTRDEVMGVISSPGNRMRPTNFEPSYATQPSYTENRRYLIPSIGGSRTSRWTDDSEFDVMAEDGSTITRTISTTSTRRSLATVTEIPTAGDNENPFDHPAYTYRSAPQQLTRGQSSGLSRNGTLSSQTTWSTQLPPLSFQSQSQSQSASPITPLTPTATPPYIQPNTTQRQADTYSLHSEDGEIYGAPSRPGLRREPTIIRHSDSTLLQGTARVEKRGRDGVVELPPLYEDATSGWAR